METQGLHDRLRVAAGERTYRQLGKLTGTHPESVRRYMQGQTPSVEYLSSLCSALEINASWLLTGQGPLHVHEVQPHALRAAEAPDLLRALSDNVSVLIRRVDRLERLVQTTEIKLRAAKVGAGTGTDNATQSGETDGRNDRRTANDESGDGDGARTPAARVGAAVAERSSGDPD